MNALTRQEHEDKIRHALEVTLAVHDDLANERATNVDLRKDLDKARASLAAERQRADFYQQRVVLVEAKCDHYQKQCGRLTALLESAADMLSTNGEKLRQWITGAHVDAYGARARQADMETDQDFDIDDDGQHIPNFLQQGPLQ